MLFLGFSQGGLCVHCQQFPVWACAVEKAGLRGCVPFLYSPFTLLWSLDTNPEEQSSAAIDWQPKNKWWYF